MPVSRSSVRGLSRELSIDLGLDMAPDESCERMMRRVDRAEVAAVCRHLVGDVARRAGMAESLVARSAG